MLLFAKNLRIRGRVPEQFAHTFGFRPSEAPIGSMIRVDLEFPDTELNAIVREWGSIAAYFGAASVDAAPFERFRDALEIRQPA